MAKKNNSKNKDKNRKDRAEIKKKFKKTNPDFVVVKEDDLRELVGRRRDGLDPKWLRGGGRANEGCRRGRHRRLGGRGGCARRWRRRLAAHR